MAILQLKDWKNRLRKNLNGWKERMNYIAADSIYGVVAASALWPAVAASPEGAAAAAGALATIIGNVGANLVAEHLSNWRSEGEAAAAIPDLVRENPEVREEIDRLLEKLQAFPEAKKSLPDAEQSWFEETLYEELQQLGNLERFAGVVGNISLGERSVYSKGDIRNSEVISGDQNQVVRDSTVEGDIIGPGGVKTVGESETERRRQAREEARRLYLRQLRLQCQRLDLETILDMPTPNRPLKLDDVYIDLDTTTPWNQLENLPADAKKSGAKRSRKDEDASERPLTAREAAARFPHLLFLGDPGGGKSSFIKVLSIQLANAYLNHGDPPQGFDRQTLPVLVSLRHLAPRLADLSLKDLAHEERIEQLRPVLQEQFEDILHRLEADRFREGLLETLRSGRCALILDGLDEVPFEQRGNIRLAVKVLLEIYPVERVLITCRKNSYRENDFPGYQVFTLARFDEPKIRAFIAAWYDTQQKIGRVDNVEKKEKTDDLTEAIFNSDDEALHTLAKNPMMLTTMAMIHQKRARLPRERVRVYREAVDLLLIRWQEQKSGKDKIAVSPKLKHFLQDADRLQNTVELLAYQTHRSGKDKKSGDLAYEAAWKLLAQSPDLGDRRLAMDFLDYIDQRSGLMVGQGGKEQDTTFTFPHRTFQEYLAGCYLARRPDAIERYSELAEAGPYWEIAVRFGMEEYRHNNRDLNTPRNYALLMSDQADYATPVSQRLLLWAADIAVDVLDLQAQSAREGAAQDQRLCQRLRDYLPTVLSGNLLPVERARAGRRLAALGDSRAGVTRVDAMEFCYVPAGPFWMGGERYNDEKPLHENSHLTYGYWLGRYPITVGQFREYLQESGREAENSNSLKDPDNHPLRYVSWHEARAFCAWLNDRWRAADRLPKGWEITLPSEAEWEKAARGGLKVPEKPLLRTIAEIGKPVELAENANPHPKREYPWGEEALTPDHANYAETGLGRTSAVGCFPKGRSLYGCEELSGNVWEWTRSLWGNYRYDPQDGREDLNAGEDSGRVVRGGAFYYGPVYLRCAYRSSPHPDAHSHGIGFRVAAAPLS